MKAILFIVMLPFIIIRAILSLFWKLLLIALVLMAIAVLFGILAPWIGLASIMGMG